MAKKKASKRKPYNKSTGRRYGPGTTDYYHNNKPGAKKKNNARRRIRRQVERDLVKKHGKAKAARMLKGKELDHKKALSKGGSNKRSNTKLIPKSKNRAKDRPTGKEERRNS